MFKDAIGWSLAQKDEEGNNITPEDGHLLVEKVREYLNENEIEYDTFSFEDLEPYLLN